MIEQTGIIEEYKYLREEITRRQDARLVILGFTVTGVGTVIGLTLGNPSVTNQGINYYALTLISFALVILIAALLITIHHTQQIDVISAYIKKYIEPNVSGIKWESRWTYYREVIRSNPKTGGLPLGTSKPLSLYYGFITIAVYSISFVTGLHTYWYTLTTVSLLAMVSLACSFDLYKRKTKGWKINWNVTDKK